MISVKFKGILYLINKYRILEAYSMNSKLTVVVTGATAAMLMVWVLSATLNSAAIPQAYAQGKAKQYSATFTDSKTGKQVKVTGTKGDIRSAFAKELDRGGVKGADKDNALVQFDRGVQRAEQGFEQSQNKPVAFSSSTSDIVPVLFSYCFNVLWWRVCISIF